MIKLTKGQEPHVLTQNKVAWTTEFVQWHSNGNGSSPRRYAHADIRNALEAETHTKCAYCEAKVKDVSYTHIEHMLPKSKHPHLVCTWSNLTIACARCNIHKGDFDSAVCPLLDPYADDVEHEIAFGGPLALPRGGPRASVTINRLELNRIDLLYSRKQFLESIYRLLDMIERAMGQPDVIESLWFEIDAMLDASREFSSACRQFLASQMAERGIARQPTASPF